MWHTVPQLTVRAVTPMFLYTAALQQQSLLYTRIFATFLFRVKRTLQLHHATRPLCRTHNLVMTHTNMKNIQGCATCAVKKRDCEIVAHCGAAYYLYIIFIYMLYLFAETAAQMRTLIEEAADKKDSLGGVVTVVCSNVPSGLGEPVYVECLCVGYFLVFLLPRYTWFQARSAWPMSHCMVLR